MERVCHREWGARRQHLATTCALIRVPYQAAKWEKMQALLY